MAPRTAVLIAVTIKDFWHGESGFLQVCLLLIVMYYSSKNSAKHLHFRFEQTEKVRIQTGKCYASFIFHIFCNGFQMLLALPQLLGVHAVPIISTH